MLKMGCKPWKGGREANEFSLSNVDHHSEFHIRGEVIKRSERILSPLLGSLFFEASHHPRLSRTFGPGSTGAIECHASGVKIVSNNKLEVRSPKSEAGTEICDV